MKVSIVIPTYKEKDNIPELFDRIFNVFKNYKINGEVIVVDDDSRDGTIETVNKYIINMKLLIAINRSVI